MDVAKAKAQLAYAEAREKYLESKAAFQEDSGNAKLKTAFQKARAALLTARDEWRNHHRTAPDGPGDGTASPAPLEVSLEVN